MNGDRARVVESDDDPVPESHSAVTISLGEGVAEFVATRGGVVNLRLRESRCCSGTLTYLVANASTRDPSPALHQWRVQGVDVRLVTPIVRPPHVIAVDLRGRIRPRLVAYLDGCAYRL